MPSLITGVYSLHSREQTCLGLPFQVSTNMSTLYRRFPGECIATFFGTIDPKTANMSQFLQLGPLDFDPDLGYVRYFWGDRFSQYPLTYLKTTSSEEHGHVRWTLSVASHPTLTKCNWFLECTPNLPAHLRASSMMRSSGRSWGPLFSPPFCYQCSLGFEPYWGLEIRMLGRPGR